MARRLVPVFCSMLLASAAVAAAGDGASSDQAAAARGYRLLLDKPYLAPDFDQRVFDKLWTTWEEPLRLKAEQATPAERRRMAFSRYGLTPRPDDPDGMPLQFVSDGKGGWVVNCFACHGGKVTGKVIPGLPNTHFAMQTLADEVNAVKLVQGKITRRDLAGLLFPRGNSNGTTNAVMFGVAVLAVRDRDLNYAPGQATLPKFVHHDMDAPPWWNTSRKKSLYSDGASHNGHRPLMQFVLSNSKNTGARIRGWEDDFRDIYAWINSLEPPAYPYEIDRQLAARGRAAFNRVCAECHGTYGPGGEYPERLVPIDEVGTDRVRLDSMTPAQHESYRQSWFSHYGEKKFRTDPDGYVAPPLDGIWASAPYFHNGSVPTLWHLLHPDRRPAVWQRSEDGYDRQKVGLEVEVFDEVPASAATPRQKRTYFDTTLFGKSAAGHRFPDQLNAEEKRAVLEYLKSL